MDRQRIVWGVGTSRTIRAHWVLAELGLEYETRPVRTRTPDTEAPDFVAVNPRQKIPVLRDGDVTIAESAAIVTWLGENYRTDDLRLVPQDPARRARYFEWMSFICMELDATSLYVLRRHWSLPEIYGEAPVANSAAEGYFARMITAAARLVDPEQPFLLGDRFTGVDILMSSTLDWADAYHQPLPQVFDDYRNRMSGRPAHRRALAANRVP